MNRAFRPQAGLAQLESEKDPILAKAGKFIKRKLEDDEKDPNARKELAMRASLLGAVPIGVFIVDVVAAYNWFFAHVAWFVGISVFMVMGAVVFTTVSNKKKPWLKWLGFLCMVASIAGVICGMYNHYQFMIYYYTYGDLGKYTNIGASQVATQFGDAGMILFTSDTAVDSSRAVGYQNAQEGGTTYCVAPVVDGSMGLSSPVAFWAVGVDCCKPRASFSCDDAGDGSAKSALMLLDKEFLVPPSMNWAIDGLASRANFDLAIKLEQAAFGTVAAKQTTLLRWTKDPTKLAGQYNSKGIDFMLSAIAVYTVFSMVLGYIVALQLVPK